jgi:hypothetical protein
MFLKICNFYFCVSKTQVGNAAFQPERRNRPASAVMNGDPFRMFVFGGWKLDSDPPVASAGLRCLTFRVPPSDASMSEEAALAQRALMMQSRNNAIAAGILFFQIHSLV